MPIEVNINLYTILACAKIDAKFAELHSTNKHNLSVAIECLLSHLSYCKCHIVEK